MTTVLIGGGWTEAHSSALYGPFLSAAGADPVVACVVLDEGDGAAQFDRWRAVLDRTTTCRPRPALVARGDAFDISLLDGANALLVCGGLTPAYADALAPVAGEIREWLAAGRPYAGFSAGAAVAANRAIVGGYRLDGRAVCPDDAGEDLEEISPVDGLGLIEFAVDVHAAQWGTLGRLSAAVAAGLVERGVAIDEDTALIIDGDRAYVAGAGAVHHVESVSTGVTVTALVDGTELRLR